jgi:hemerythrin-like domain-containing protein
MLELLTMHTYLENEVMYPEVRKALPDLEDDVLESYEEHHVADVLCRELLELDPTNEHFDAKTTVLIENVEHHMAEEEQEWFPKVRSGLGRKALLEIGQRLEAVRPKAPTKPEDPRAVASARKAVTA